MNIGIIGFGVIGQLLASAWSDHPVHIMTRSPDRLLRWSRDHTTATIHTTPRAVVDASTLVCLCVKPRDYPELVHAIRPYLHAQHIVLIVTSPVTIDQLERCCPSKIAQIIPSITNRQREGALLTAYGSRVTEEDRSILLPLFEALGTPLCVTSQHVRIAADLASCAPAYIARWLHQLAIHASARTGLPYPMAEQLIATMVRGTGHLLCADVSLYDIYKAVQVPGGLTATGIRILDERLSGVWETMLDATDRQFASECAHIASAFARLDDEIYESPFGNDHTPHFPTC